MKWIFFPLTDIGASRLIGKKEERREVQVNAKILKHEVERFACPPRLRIHRVDTADLGTEKRTCDCTIQTT